MIKLLLGDRIVFVIVTAAAVESQGHPDAAGRFHSIDHRLHKPFLLNETALSVQAMITVEATRHDLIRCGIGQHVARELFDGKLVEREVAVEGIDHPVAPRPHLPGTIGLETIAVGEARIVQPGHGHPLAVAGRSEQSVDHFFISLRRLIRQECSDLLC